MNQTVSDIKRPFLDVYKALDVKTQRKAMKDQLVDNFIYASVSPTYLAGVIDTL